MGLCFGQGDDLPAVLLHTKASPPSAATGRQVTVHDHRTCRRSSWHQLRIDVTATLDVYTTASSVRSLAPPHAAPTRP
jgi:hypothetical protein